MQKNKEKRLTPLFLKTISQKFDLAIIFFLNVSNFNLPGIDSLVECQNLLILDISGNVLTSLQGFDALTKLKKLNVAYNKISVLDPIKALKELEVFEAQGNSISEIEQVNSVRNLPRIRSIYFQEFDYSGQNPICRNSDYRETVKTINPRLKSLDGHRYGVPEMTMGDFGELNFNIQEYNSKEKWYAPDIKKAKVELFSDSDVQISKKENELKDALKDVHSRLNQTQSIHSLN